MATSGTLHTINKDHAIKEAVISFTVSPQIVNPTKYRDLISKDQPLYEKYHKFEPLKLRELKVETGLDTNTIVSEKDAGFKFIAFNDGKACSVIQGLSQPRFGIFTFNTIDYKDWNTFKKDSLDAAEAIAKFQDIYTVTAFSLTYIDEFYFDDESAYSPKELFNLESKNLPKGIEDSDFVDFNYNLKRHQNNYVYFENFSIRVFNEGSKKTIRITNNLTFEIKPISFTDIFILKSGIEEYLDYIHQQNKNTLRDILNETVANRIKL